MGAKEVLHFFYSVMLGNRCKTGADWGSAIGGQMKPAVSVAILVHRLASGYRSTVNPLLL